jgi:hypothetical protein
MMIGGIAPYGRTLGQDALHLLLQGAREVIAVAEEELPREIYGQEEGLVPALCYQSCI